MDLANADITALRALTCLLADDSRRDRFLSLTGITEDQFKPLLDSLDFKRAVLGFYMDYEPDLIWLADQLECAPEHIQAAWRAFDSRITPHEES